MKGFNDELSAFIGRVKERAQARIDKAMKEYEEVRLLVKLLFTTFIISFVYHIVLIVGELPSTVDVPGLY